jgi:hypothetical protein
MKPNNTVIRGRIIGLGNSAILDQTIYYGFRIRDTSGQVRHFNAVFAAPSVNILLQTAFSSGEEIEMWFCGTAEKQVLYGIKSFDDEAYEVSPAGSAIAQQGTMYFLLGLLLAFFLVGFLIMFYAFYLWSQAGKFSPYDRYEFERSPSLANGGFRGGDLHIMQSSTPSRVSAAQEVAEKAKKVDDLKAWVAKHQSASSK